MWLIHCSFFLPVRCITGLDSLHTVYAIHCAIRVLSFPYPVAESSMSKSKNSNCCCKLVITVAFMALTVVVGGIILWQFLPEESKASVQEGVQDIFNKTDGIPDLEIPDNPFDNSVPNDGYVFNQCDDDLSNCCNGLGFYL